jgi:hypothetical protein
MPNRPCFRAHIAELKSNTAKSEHENLAFKAKMEKIAHEKEELAEWFREHIACLKCSFGQDGSRKPKLESQDGIGKST